MPTTMENGASGEVVLEELEETDETDSTISGVDSGEKKMTNRLDEGCELQQLVGDDDEGREGEGEETTLPASSPICKITQTSPTTPNSTKLIGKRHEYERIPTCDDDAIQVSTPVGSESQRSAGLTVTAVNQTPSPGPTMPSLSRIATAPAMSTLGTGGQNTRLLFVNEKLSRGPSLMSDHGGIRSTRERVDRAERPGQSAPRAQIKRGATSIGLTSNGSHSQLNHLLQSRSRLPGLEGRSALRGRLRDTDRSCQHHCFLTDVTDVHHMEEALLHLLEDFHSGKLRAFGKDCSMEQMTGIREQQERLARLHFDLGAQGELYPPLSDEGLRAGQDNMQSLMGSLEQLSVSIERLHSFSESRESSQQPE